MFSPESGLKRIVDFTEDRGVRDGAVVIKVIWVQAWLLQNGRDGGNFKVRGDGAS